MREIPVIGQSLTAAYHNALYAMYYGGEKVDCPAWNTRTLEAALTMMVMEPLSEPRISKFFPGTPYDLEKYRQEMLDGIMDFKVGDGWDYTYHSRMTYYPTANVLRASKIGYESKWMHRDQLKFVVKELKKDPNSRRAVIDTRSVYFDTISEDPACLQHIQYFIRNGKLDCSVLFRSNDLLEATFMNAYALICLQERIAGELGVAVGTYTHRANSCHVYEKDWERFCVAVARIDSTSLDKLSYRYDGDWDELMRDEQPRIKKFVEGLR